MSQMYCSKHRAGQRRIFRIHPLPRRGLTYAVDRSRIKEAIGGKNPVRRAIELFAAYESDHFGWAKEIWDVAVIGYLINPEWVPTKLVHSPMLTDDSHWAHDERRHLIREAYFAAAIRSSGTCSEAGEL